MPLNTVSVAAATAVLGYDMLSTRNDIATAGRNRVLRALGLTGSAAAGDSALDIYVGTVRVATIYNSATGFPSNDAAKFPTAYAVPPSTPISAIVVDAPATNPLNLLIDV